LRNKYRQTAVVNNNTRLFKPNLVQYIRTAAFMLLRTTYFLPGPEPPPPARNRW